MWYHKAFCHRYVYNVFLCYSSGSACIVVFIGTESVYPPIVRKDRMLDVTILPLGCPQR